MFKFLRSRAKIFYWVIAASFILFIFLAWGMDVSGRRTASPAQTGEIGAVNGVGISIQQWQQWVRRAESQVRRQAGDREVNANQLAAAREQAWEQMVRDVIVTQEVERLGLSASDHLGRASIGAGTRLQACPRGGSGGGSGGPGLRGDSRQRQPCPRGSVALNCCLPDGPVVRERWERKRQH